MKSVIVLLLTILPYFGNSEFLPSVLPVHLDSLNINVDLTWVHSVGTWYFPIWNSVTAARVATVALGKTEFTPEELTSSCVSLSSDFQLVAYGKTVAIEVTPSDGTGISFSIPSRGAGGRFSFRKTDMSTYIVGVTKWDDGKVTWGVMTTEKFLPPQVEQEIRDFIGTLGCTDQEILINDYSKCV